MPRPDIFYSYQPANDERRINGIFVNNVFHFSTPDGFNDPFECRPLLRGNPNFVPPRRELMRLAAKYMPGAPRAVRRAEVYRREAEYRDTKFRAEQDAKLRESLSSLFQRTSIGCFCAVPDSIRMWSHYASKHEGFCVGFSFTEPWTHVDQQSGGRLQMAPQPVLYREKYPEIDVYGDWETSIETRIELVKNAVLTKSTHWSDEQEWRCFRPSVPSGLQSFPPGALRRVLLGQRSSDELSARIVELVRGRTPTVEVLRACIAPDRFAINFEPVEQGAGAPGAAR